MRKRDRWQEGVENRIQSHAAGYNPCTLLRDSAHVRQGSYFISEENVKASWYKPTLALKGIFKHIWAWALMERKLRNGSDTMKYECGLLLGKSLANILETVMCTILEEFECVLYKECVRNSPFAFLFLFPFAVWWYHRAVFLVLC